MRHAPPFVALDPLYLERLAQYVAGALDLCDCPAGQALTRYLKRLYAQYMNEALDNPMMAQAATNGTHPDLETAIHNLARGPQPTLRMHHEQHPD